ETPRLDVVADRVALAGGSDGPADRGLGSDVACHETARGTAEAAIGQQRDRLAQPLAYDGRRDAQHLAHTRSAAGPFVADDHHVACVDLATGHGGHGGFFAVEHTRRTGVRLWLV